MGLVEVYPKPRRFPKSEVEMGSAGDALPSVELQNLENKRLNFWLAAKSLSLQELYAKYR